MVGLLDIGVMIYCIMNKISYSSSLNIFSLIAGILLVKGSVKTARVVSWFTSFMLVGFPAIFLIMLFIEPFGLKITTFNLNLVGMIVGTLISIVIIILVF